MSPLNHKQKYLQIRKLAQLGKIGWHKKYNFKIFTHLLKNLHQFYSLKNGAGRSRPKEASYEHLINLEQATDLN